VSRPCRPAERSRRRRVFVLSSPIVNPKTEAFARGSGAVCLVGRRESRCLLMRWSRRSTSTQRGHAFCAGWASAIKEGQSPLCCQGCPTWGIGTPSHVLLLLRVAAAASLRVLGLPRADGHAPRRADTRRELLTSLILSRGRWSTSCRDVAVATRALQTGGALAKSPRLRPLFSHCKSENRSVRAWVRRCVPCGAARISLSV